MAAKHFIIYYKKGTGTYIITEPRPWSRENKHHFPNYTFQGDNHPSTNTIEEWLIDNKDFQRIVNNQDISLIQNVDPNLDL